jgi:hypothetical protein
MSEKLKPCPFCGGKVSINYEETYYIECHNCMTQVKPSGKRHSEAVCRAHWNGRHHEPLR